MIDFLCFLFVILLFVVVTFILFFITNPFLLEAFLEGWTVGLSISARDVRTEQYLTLPGIFHMEWCIKYDKIETLTMEYTWNGME